MYIYGYFTIVFNLIAVLSVVGVSDTESFIIGILVGGIYNSIINNHLHNKLDRCSKD
jgi:hypothetical protein